MAISADSGSYSYEVYCNSCRVSFPVGTRRCLHCGSATSAERGAAGARVPPLLRPSLETLPPLDEIEQSPTATARPRVGFSPSSLLWILFLVAYGFVKSCT
jgi:hypothetical protein